MLLKKPLAGHFLLALLCLPVFFINVRDSHDWGDDFAGYIHQSANIINGTPQSETGFLVSPYFQGVSVVPDIGFPLMLSPVYYLQGNDVRAFLLFISLTLYLLAFALMSYFKRYFSALISIFLVLIILYNPWTLEFKAEILSDIPFTLLLVLSVNFFLTKGIDKTIHCVILGIMVGYLISIRTVGLAFPLALLCLLIKTLVQTPDMQEKKKLIKHNLLVAVSIAGMYFLLNKLLFTIPSQASYVDPGELSLQEMGSRFLLNLNGYPSFIHTFFRGLGRYEFMSIIARSLVVVSLLIGIIYKYKEKIGFIEFLVPIYLLTIMLFGDCRCRYLFPILPFLVYYMVIGLERIKLNLHINKNIVTCILGLFILIQYYPEVKWIIKHQHETQKGPQESASIEAFAYIKKNTPENSAIVFEKPRVLALYTGRTGMDHEHTDNYEKLKINFEKMGINYLLIHTEVSLERTLTKYTEAYKEEVELVWTNEKFSLYQLP